MAQTKKKTKKKSTPFKVPKGKTQIHLLVAIDDKGEAAYHEPSDDHDMENAITNVLYEMPDNGPERIIDVHHIVIDLKPPKARVAPKAKKATAKKVRDGAAEAKKADKEKKAAEAKAAKEKKAAETKAKKASKKKAGKKRASKADATPAASDAAASSDAGAGGYGD